jgi:hypothetical protein
LRQLAPRPERKARSYEGFAIISQPRRPMRLKGQIQRALAKTNAPAMNKAQVAPIAAENRSTIEANLGARAWLRPRLATLCIVDHTIAAVQTTI